MLTPRLSENMVVRPKVLILEALLSAEAGGSKKAPDHLTWPVITLYPLVSADTLQTRLLAESIGVSFLNQMTPKSFNLYHYRAVNASVVD